MRPIFRRSFPLGLLLSLAALCAASEPALAAKRKPASEETSTPTKRAKAASSEKTRAAAADKPGTDKPKRRGGASIGSPNRGRLEAGVRLKPSGHVKLREGARGWGLPALVKAIHRAGDKVASKYPRSVLLVGDLSGKNGGALDGHHSHQSGRDADIGFYFTNSKGKPVSVTRFVAVDAEGRAREPSWARFDDARNWLLVEELLKDERAGVRYVFVSTALRARLLKYAASKKVNKDLIARAAAAMMSPDNADVHDDHFHVRITCPETMRPECVEESGARDPAAPKVEDGAATASGSVTESPGDRPQGASRSSGVGDASRPAADADPY